MKISIVGVQLVREEGQADGGQTDSLKNMTMKFANLSATLKLQASILSIKKVNSFKERHPRCVC